MSNLALTTRGSSPKVGFKALPQTVTLLAQIATLGGAAPSQRVKRAMNDFFKSGVTAKLDTLHVLPTADPSANALRANWIPGGPTLTNNGMTFSAGVGLVGTASGWADTGFAINGATSKFTQDEAHIGWVVLDAPSTYEVGAWANVRLEISRTNILIRLNNSTAGGGAVKSAFAVGHKVFSRSAGVVSAYLDGDLLAAYTIASATRESATLKIGGAKDNSNFNTGVRYCAVHAGGALTADEVADLRYALIKLLRVLSPSVPDFQSIGDNVQWTLGGVGVFAQNAGLSSSLLKRGREVVYEAGNLEFSAAGAGDTLAMSKSRSEIAPAANAHKVTATVASSTITLGGSIFTGAIVVVHINDGGWTGNKVTTNGNALADQEARAHLKSYYEVASASDTLTTLAARLSAKIAVDFAGTTSSGAVITLAGTSGKTVTAHTGGETTWTAYSWMVEPSTLGLPNTAAWGPLFGQIHTTDARGPALAIGLYGEDLYLTAETAYAYPLNYSTNVRKLHADPLPWKRGEVYDMVVAFTDGVGVTTDTYLNGQPPIMGPNHAGYDPVCPAVGLGLGAVKVWVRGKLVLDLINIPTSSADSGGSYFKPGGLYFGCPMTNAADRFRMHVWNFETGYTDLSARITAPKKVYR